MSKLKNIHPGEILLEEFLIPMGISQNFLARSIMVSPRRINEIVHEKRSITADTDLRLSRFFGTSEGFWVGLQSDFDLEKKRGSVIKQLRCIKAFSKIKPAIDVFPGKDKPVDQNQLSNFTS